MISALFLGSMLRARKYRFALCFRVLSNQYVGRSAYAKFFKFNREKKRFERAKVDCRCFHWFLAAILASPGGTNAILNTTTYSDALCRITRVRNIVHFRDFGVLFIYYSSAIFKFLDVIYGMIISKRSYFSLA